MLVEDHRMVPNLIVLSVSCYVPISYLGPPHLLFLSTSLHGRKTGCRSTSPGGLASCSRTDLWGKRVSQLSQRSDNLLAGRPMAILTCRPVCCFRVALFSCMCSLEEHFLVFLFLYSECIFKLSPSLSIILMNFS